MTFTEAIAKVECDIVVPPETNQPKRGRNKIIDLDKDKRRFPRIPCSVDAVLQYQDGLPSLPRPHKWMRIKVQNVSRCGMGFLHSEPMYPPERALIIFPRGIQRIFVVSRCRRIGSYCFEIGGEFSELLDNPTEEGLR